MPRIVVLLVGFRVEVEPQEVDVVWKETDGEKDDKRKNHFGHFTATSYHHRLLILILLILSAIRRFAPFFALRGEYQFIWYLIKMIAIKTLTTKHLVNYNSFSFSHVDPSEVLAY